MKQPRMFLRAPAPQQGMTLIEMMVVIVIGTILSLAVYGVLASAEGRKRSTTSVSDIEQTGGFAMQSLDALIRGAGAGFGQSGLAVGSVQAATYGCAVYAASNGARILPRTAALPAPFASVNPGTSGLFRLAPVLILPNQTSPGDAGTRSSDVLVVMASSSGGAEYVGVSTAAPTSAAMTLANTTGFAAGDIVLVGDQPGSNGASGISPCMLQQVATGFVGGTATSLSLGGSRYLGTIGSVSMTGYTDAAIVQSMGNITGGNPPIMQVLGVGDHSTLFSYDLLQSTANPLQPVSDGVFLLKARYGVSTGSDGKVDSWIDPSATGSFSLASLMDGSATAAESIKNIKAIKVGLIMRTSLRERTVVGPESITLFADLGDDLDYTVDLSSDERYFRYRSFELTIPLRNNML